MKIIIVLFCMSWIVGCSVSGDGPGSRGSTGTGLGPYAQAADGPSASPAIGPTASGSDGPSASPTTQITLTETDLYEEGEEGHVVCVSDYFYLFSDKYNQYLDAGTHVESSCNEMKIMDGDQLVFQAILHEQKCQIDLKYFIGLIIQKETRDIPDCPNVTQ